MTWIAAVAASVAATAAIGKYAYEEYQADEAAKNRPVYEIPKEITENLTQAQQQSLQGLPEEQKQQYIENIQRGSAQSLAASQSRKGGLSGITAINQQQGQAYNQMLSMDAQARAQNQRALMQQKGVMADYRDQAFQFNVVNPYYEKIAGEKQRTDDLASGLTSASSVFASGMGGVSGTGTKSPSKTTASTTTPNVTQSGVNPYSQNTDRMGSYQDPQTGQMFVQEPANPSAPPPLSFEPTPYYGQQYNPYSSNLQ